MIAGASTYDPAIAYDSKKATRAWADVDRAGADRYKIVHRALLERGVYLAPSAYEVFFVSTAHTTEQLQRTAQAMGEALALAYKDAK